MTGILIPPSASESNSERTGASGLAADKNEAKAVQPGPQFVDRRKAQVEPYLLLERRMQQHWKRGFNSVFIAAFAIYVACSLFCSFNSPIDFDPYKYIYRGWTWWIFDDMRRDKQIHNVALLGSSLMVSAVAGGDANFLNKSLDLTDYHKAANIDNLLTTKFGGKFNTFNLAAPGQMPSDAFMMLKGMVNTADRPEVVIYGIAPRDFIDSTMNSPVDTEPFHYLKRIVNLDDVSSALFRDPISKLDFWLQKTAYFYQNSLDFEMALSDKVSDWLARALPPDPSHPFTYWDRVKLLPNYLPGEMKPRAVMSEPISKQDAVNHYRDNTQEYVERYHRPDKHTYTTQFYFLKKLSEYCKREKIELIIINMPIRKANITILKPWWYLNYLQAIREFSFYNNVAMFDLTDFEYYNKGDFHDSVHLNGFGAQKLFQRMVSTFSSNLRTSTAFELAGKQLERHQKLSSLKVTPL